MENRSDPLSIVLPLMNGAPWLRAVIGAIRADAGARELDVIAVDDGSTDGSAEILAELEARGWLRTMRGPGRGAAAAINAGLRAARFPFVAQIDQDVVIEPGWIDTLTAALDDPSVAAAQGHYVCPPHAPLAARVMGVDLAQRYDALRGRATTHVCTGNVIYRARALADLGLFDESLGYGYDNDISYRLRAAGHQLVICHDATSAHHWRSGLAGYARQQYGFGYGRLDLVAKHPTRIGGDSVSPLAMMLHPIVLLIALVLATIAGIFAWTGHDSRAIASVAFGLAGALAIERAIAGVRAAIRFREAAALLFPFFHLVRDAAWVGAIATWTMRRALGGPSAPRHSMTARERASFASAPATQDVARASATPSPTARVIAVIPAHNESAHLPSVLDDLRAHCPDIDVLVVDDGSRDRTWAVARTYGVHWMRLPERMGVGSAVRAGLCYAERMGYRTAIRLDGDGQHSAADIARLLAPIADGRADATLGSRYIQPHDDGPNTVRVIQRLLASCLSRLVDAPVTDPTSGFYAFGPRALAVLAEHHPTGYPEPELRLFLDRNALTAVEVPVRALPRLGGRTSLTPFRVTAAAARVLLAMLIVPLRRTVGDADRD